MRRRRPPLQQPETGRLPSEIPCMPSRYRRMVWSTSPTAAIGACRCTTSREYITQVFINRTEAASAAGLSFSPDAQQTYLYVADYGNSHVAVLNRKTLEVLLSVRQEKPGPGRLPGTSPSRRGLQGQLVYRGGRARESCAEVRVQRNVGAADTSSPVNARRRTLRSIATPPRRPSGRGFRPEHSWRASARP